MTKTLVFLRDLFYAIYILAIVIGVTNAKGGGCMLSSTRWFVIAIALLVVVGGCRPTIVDEITPITNQGQKWRIAYYEGGPYQDYPLHLRAIVAGLIQLGWMDPLDLPSFDNPEESRLLWKSLADHAHSEYIEFVPDAYWSADWSDDLRWINRQAAIDRLKSGDIDLMLAMGTWAGLDLANNEHSVPTLVVSASDPVRAGIIKSAKDSGFDHVHAQCDPTQFLRQVRLFHDIIGFQRLGVVYDDSPDGRTYANLADLQQAAAERDFEVVACQAQDSNVTAEQARQEASQCIELLAPRIDAFWFSAHVGLHNQYLPGQLAPFFEYRVATWSQIGAPAVRRGVLMSIARQDLSGVGLWTAKNIAKIFHGSQPRALNQVYEHPASIALNLETARRIGYEPPASILEIADEVYTEIETE